MSQRETSPATDSHDPLWGQLANAVAMVVKADQIVWAVLGAFSAASTVLVAALFAGGDPSTAGAGPGIVVCAAGLLFSLVWVAAQERALAYLRSYEVVVERLEERLEMPSDLSLGVKVGGPSIRQLMIAFPAVLAVAWLVGLFVFSSAPWGR